MKQGVYLVFVLDSKAWIVCFHLVDACLLGLVYLCSVLAHSEMQAN